MKATGKGALDRFNRSFEYDGLGDAYARFLIDELLPEVETKTAPDGRAIKLSKDGNDRGIGGSSSGAIAAFTAAWERPDSFRRVFSSIGTYVDLRGGNDYPSMIRKFEPRPIRIFLQDGDHDLNIYGGDWWMANQEMERAFAFAGYEVDHAWGTGGHDGRQAGQVFPDAMKFLWKGYPEPVKAGPGSQQLKEILIPGENWSLVGDGYQFNEGPTPNAKGEVFFTDIPKSKAYKIGLDGAVSVFLEDTRNTNGQAFGPDGRLYGLATGTAQLLAYDSENKPTVIADGFRGNDLVINHEGGIYATAPGGMGQGVERGLLHQPEGRQKGRRHGPEIPQWRDAFAGPVAPLRRRLPEPLGLQLSGPGRRLTRQQAEILSPPHPRRADDASPDGLRVDTDGRLYVATQSRHPGLRPARPRQRRDPDAQRPDFQPLLRRREFRHHLRHLRRPRLQAQGQDQGRPPLRAAHQAADAEAVSTNDGVDLARCRPHRESGSRKTGLEMTPP